MVVSEPAAEIAKHTHLIANLALGRELRFVDPRTVGKLSVHSAGFDPGGVEPLEVSAEQFVALFRGRKTPIKSALLNQKLVRGVGNIYADESLFRAGIRPRRRAAVITLQELAISNFSNFSNFCCHGQSIVQLKLFPLFDYQLSGSGWTCERTTARRYKCSFTHLAVRNYFKRRSGISSYGIQLS